MNWGVLDADYTILSKQLARPKVEESVEELCEKKGAEDAVADGEVVA